MQAKEGQMHGEDCTSRVLVDVSLQNGNWSAVYMDGCMRPWWMSRKAARMACIAKSLGSRPETPQRSDAGVIEAQWIIGDGRLGRVRTAGIHGEAITMVTQSVRTITQLVAQRWSLRLDKSRFRQARRSKGSFR